MTATTIGSSAADVPRLKVLELYCGIGGCAAALQGRAEVVAAVDINTHALAVYGHNFPHPVLTRTIESLDRNFLAACAADLWWLSPPCQPFTHRGPRRDLDDPRSLSLLSVMGQIEDVRPPYVALENVPGFGGSRAHDRIRHTLKRCGYLLQEHDLCPTQLGVPNRRRRFYLLASRTELARPSVSPQPQRPLAEFLEPHTADSDLMIPDALLRQYDGALDIVDAREPQAICSCFTSAYGRSPVRSGSYLRTDQGVRRFAPREVLRLLGFPPDYSLPPELTRRQAWSLLGNSLSVPIVRWLLASIPELAGHAAA